MKIRAVLLDIIAVGVFVVAAASLLATTIPVQSKAVVKKSCAATGGLCFRPSKTSPTWGCLNNDGSGIVCGGVTTAQKKTCDTFRKAPPHLPTRAEIAKAEAAATAKQEK